MHYFSTWDRDMKCEDLLGCWHVWKWRLCLLHHHFQLVAVWMVDITAGKERGGGHILSVEWQMVQMSVNASLFTLQLKRIGPSSGKMFTALIQRNLCLFVLVCSPTIEEIKTCFDKNCFITNKYVCECIFPDINHVWGGTEPDDTSVLQLFLLRD